MNEVMAERGLTDLEVYVMVERISGRSYRLIGTDAEIIRLGESSRRNKPGTCYPAAAVKQIEQRAMLKLGVTVSVEVAVHAAERFDSAMRLRERARTVPHDRVRVLRNGCKLKLPKRERMAAMAHERSVSEFFKSKGVVHV